MNEFAEIARVNSLIHQFVLQHSTPRSTTINPQALAMWLHIKGEKPDMITHIIDLLPFIVDDLQPSSVKEHKTQDHTSDFNSTPPSRPDETPQLQFETRQRSRITQQQTKQTKLASNNKPNADPCVNQRIEAIQKQFRPFNTLLWIDCDNWSAMIGFLGFVDERVALCLCGKNVSGIIVPRHLEHRVMTFSDASSKKNAADVCLCFHIGRHDACLPPDITFFVLTGDGFADELTSSACTDYAIREIHRFDPHLYLGKDRAIPAIIDELNAAASGRRL